MDGMACQVHEKGWTMVLWVCVMGQEPARMWIWELDHQPWPLADVLTHHHGMPAAFLHVLMLCMLGKGLFHVPLARLVDVGVATRVVPAQPLVWLKGPFWKV